MKKYILIIPVIVFMLSACAPDPRKEAQAFQIREQAQQDALNQEQTRQHADELHAFQMQQQQIEQGNREATKQEWRNGLNMMIRYSSFFATAAVCFAVFMITRATVNAYAIVSEGTARALVQAANVRANLISLDPTTRQFPLLLQYIGKGIVSLTNPNADSTLLLDTRNEPDRQMIQAMGAVQYAGALAHEARQAKDPAGVSIIQTPIVDVEEQ